MQPQRKFGLHEIGKAAAQIDATRAAGMRARAEREQGKASALRIKVFAGRKLGVQKAHDDQVWHRGLDDNLAVIKESVLDFASVLEALSSRRPGDFTVSSVRDGQRQITRHISTEFGPNPSARNEIARRFVQEMSSIYPIDDTSNNLICDTALELGVIREAEKKFPESICFSLPKTIQNIRVVDGVEIEMEGTRTVHTRYYSPLAESRDLTHLLQVRADVCRKKYLDDKRQAMRDLYQEGTTGSLLEVLKRGSGECAFFAPDEESSDGRVFYGGHLRIRLQAGEIEPVRGIQGLARKVSDMVRANVRIPISSISEHRVATNGHDGEVRILIINLHSLCRRGLANARREAEEKGAAEEVKEAMSKLATIDLKTWCEGGVVGTAFVFLPTAWRADDPKKQARPKYYPNVYFLIERSEDGNVRVVDGSESARDLLGEFIGTSQEESRVRNPLGLIMRLVKQRNLPRDEVKEEIVPAKGEGEVVERAE